MSELTALDNKISVHRFYQDDVLYKVNFHHNTSIVEIFAWKKHGFIVKKFKWEIVYAGHAKVLSKSLKNFLNQQTI